MKTRQYKFQYTKIIFARCADLQGVYDEVAIVERMGVMGFGGGWDIVVNKGYELKNN